jgi:hypothetical protein
MYRVGAADVSMPKPVRMEMVDTKLSPFGRHAFQSVDMEWSIGFPNEL